MKRILTHIATCSFLAMSLAACGGSGGDAPVPTTKVVLSAYLFGTMSSSTANVTSVHASMKVPSAVFADYSAPAGTISGTFPLRSRAIIPTGSLAGTTGASGTYNTQTGIVELSIYNLNGNTIIPLRSSTNGSGTEFAKIYFKLATTDVNTPFSPLNQSLTYDILQSELSSQLNASVPARGCELKFSTSYQ